MHPEIEGTTENARPDNVTPLFGWITQDLFGSSATRFERTFHSKNCACTRHRRETLRGATRHTSQSQHSPGADVVTVVVLLVLAPCCCCCHHAGAAAASLQGVRYPLALGAHGILLKHVRYAALSSRAANDGRTIDERCQVSRFYFSALHTEVLGP